MWSFCFTFFSGAENKLKTENDSSFAAFVVAAFLFEAALRWRCLRFGNVSHFSLGVVVILVIRVVLVVALTMSGDDENLQVTNAAAGLTFKKNAPGTCSTFAGYPLWRGKGKEEEEEEEAVTAAAFNRASSADCGSGRCSWSPTRWLRRGVVLLKCNPNTRQADTSHKITNGWR